MSDWINGSTSAMPLPSDAQFAEMVERAQAGDEEAIASFLEHHQVSIVRYLRYTVGNDEVAQDLYSEVAEKVWRALPKTNERLRHPQAARKWMFTIAWRLTLNYFKACNHLKTVSLEDLEQRARAGEVSAAKDWHTVERLSTPGAEEFACFKEESMEKRKLMTEALRNVPGQLGTCFYMKDVQGLTHQEIAQALNISESTARAYASRGRQAVIKGIAQLLGLEEGRIG